MKSHVRWLNVQVESWVADGVITPEQADRLRDRYASGELARGASWGIILFAGFGAVVLGLGVILILAYNWDKIHRLAKLALVVSSVPLAHGIGIRLRARGKEGFGHALHLLGTMLFGAGIWLVAQIYHISSHYPNAFFAWAAGALLFAWMLPSIPQGLLAAALLAIWAGTESFGFGNPILSAPALILPGVGWLAWRLRSGILLSAAIFSFALTVLFGASVSWEHTVPALLALALLLAAIGILAEEGEQFPTAGPLCSIWSAVLYIPILFILTFNGVAEDLLERHDTWRWDANGTASWIIHGTLALGALAAIAVAAARPRTRRLMSGTAGFTRLLLPFAVFVIFELLWLRSRAAGAGRDWADAGALMALAASAAWCWHVFSDLWRGSRLAEFPPVLRGSLMLAVWIFARFTDLFDSLLARGVVFLALGAALFAVAIVYQRTRKRLDSGGTGEGDR